MRGLYDPGSSDSDHGGSCVKHETVSGEERRTVYRMPGWRSNLEGYEVSVRFRTSRPTGRGRSDSTKLAELRFCALLTEGNSRMIFYREGFGRLKDNLA